MSDNYVKEYNPTDWIQDQVISEPLMDHIETGISNAYLWLSDLDAIAQTAVTEQQVNTIINSKGYITNTVNNLTNYTKTTDLPTAMNNYLIDEGYAKSSEIPANVSDLTNDAGYITVAQVPDEVFIAEYGTTTYADVLAAYQNGKTIICRKDSTVVYLTIYDSLSSTFYFDNFRMGMSVQYRISSSGGWAYGTTNYVSTSRTINNKALSSNITLTAADVDATTSAQVQTMIDDALAAIPVADQTVYAQSNS